MSTDVITVRNASSADLDGIDQLLSQTFTRLLKADYPPSVQVTAVPLIAKVNPALVSSGTYYVAEDRDGSILGAGGWTRSIKGPGFADVRHFVTRHTALRRGIARRLMMGVLSEARVAGVTQLECLSTRTAVPFYRSMGFDVVKDLTIGLRPGIDFPVVKMVRAL